MRQIELWQPDNRHGVILLGERLFQKGYLGSLSNLREKIGKKYQTSGSATASVLIQKTCFERE